ncbi:MAG: hypothetical protein O3A10_11515 [Chloroflexi bacterium]|nr:hypothetical protein [Chloroflexota bacterium]MDA1147146.1 hypothetical protein [Chloroflexota bacterium]
MVNLIPDAAAEHAPMWALTELPVHEWSPQTNLVEETTDPRAYERYWWTAQDSTGELLVVTGFALYPNLGTVESFSIVNLRGQHTTVRAHRKLTGNRFDMRVGPIEAQLVAPFKEWHLTLDENPYGISYDLRWLDTKRSIAQPAMIGGYETFGRIEGTVRVGSEEFTLTEAAFSGSRDHHWGVRDGVGGPGHLVRPIERATATATSGQWVEFGDWSVWLHRILYNLGDPRPGTGRIIKMERELSFDPDTQLFTGGTVHNTLEGGEVKSLHFRPLGHQVAFLRCGMYGGRGGGTPEGDIWHGMFVGENVVSGETYDVTDPAIRLKLRGGSNYHCEVTCDDEVTTGLFETHDPITYEMCRDAEPGHSLRLP